MDNDIVMQEMITNHENCRIYTENNETVIKLRPKAIEESLDGKLNAEDIVSAGAIVKEQAEFNMINGELYRGCQNLNCSNKHKCLASLPTGNRSARVMFINKMPSKYETGTQCCLSDSGGAFLSLILSKMHVSRNDVYCTDMIKCNTNLDEYSFNECVNHYLNREITLVNPSIIICNGLSVLKACAKSSIITGLPDNVAYGNIYDVAHNGIPLKIVAIYDLDTVLKKENEAYNKCKDELWGQLLRAFKSI